MPIFISWLRKNWMIILLVMNAPALVMISIWYWFWSNAHLEWDSNNAALFNNIVSPFISIVSGVLVYLALRAAIRQNKVSFSQNLKDNFDKEFDLLKRQLEEQTYIFEFTPNLNQGSINSPPQTVDSINIFKFFDDISFRLTSISHYNDDLQSYYNGELFDIAHFRRRYPAYVDYIKFLNPFALHGVHGMKRVKYFVEKITSAELIDQDKIHLKHRIRQELLDKYFKFMWSNRMTDQQFMIPMIFKSREDGKVEFKPFAFSKIGEEYDYFTEALKEVIT